MAKFCADVDIQYTKPDYATILYKGHRGFISYEENDLAKEFDKRLELLRDKYSVAKAEDEERKGQRWQYRPSETLQMLELWYEEGVAIANEIFEEAFLK